MRFNFPLPVLSDSAVAGSSATSLRRDSEARAHSRMRGIVQMVSGVTGCGRQAPGYGVV
jgi:hypothetical protein